MGEERRRDQRRAEVGREVEREIGTKSGAGWRGWSRQWVAASGSTPHQPHPSVHVMDPLNKVFSSHQTLINLGASTSCSASRASCLCGQGRDPRLLSVWLIAMFYIFPHLTSIPTLVTLKPLSLLCVLLLRRVEAGCSLGIAYVVCLPPRFSMLCNVAPP
jgi:hypothetical protein